MQASPAGAMTLTVTGRHIELSPLVRQQIERRFTRLERLLNDSAVSAQCVVTQERQRIVCELTLHARGDHMLVGVGRHDAPDHVPSAPAIEKVKQQAQRLSDRWKTRRRSGQKLAEVAPWRPGRPQRRSRGPRPPSSARDGTPSSLSVSTRPLGGSGPRRSSSSGRRRGAGGRGLPSPGRQGRPDRARRLRCRPA